MTTSSQKLSVNGKRTALASFLGGTFIFLFFYSRSDPSFLFLGFGFAIIAGIINLIVLGQILFHAYKNSDERKKLFTTSGIMLLNLPVLIFYIWFAGVLLNTMRVTFVNNLQSEVKDIEITGCEPKHIDKLSPGESKTVWIRITGDCGLDMNYEINGQRKSESVAGYCTNGMGEKMTHEIGTEYKPGF